MCLDFVNSGLAYGSLNQKGNTLRNASNRQLLDAHCLEGTVLGIGKITWEVTTDEGAL